MKGNIILSVIGPDGSGKTSIIKKLTEKLSKEKIKYKYFHLKPEVLSKNKPVSDPHNQIPRSKFLCFLKIIYWLILFRVYFILSFFSNTKIYIFDRYPDDLLIDYKRYRFKLDDKITIALLKLFPRPSIWINMTGDAKEIWNRKKEIELEVLGRLLIKYSNFVKDKNHLSIKELDDYEKIYNFIFKNLK